MIVYVLFASLCSTVDLRYYLQTDQSQLRMNMNQLPSTTPSRLGAVAETAAGLVTSLARASVVNRTVDRLERATTVGDELDTDKSAAERRRNSIPTAVADDDRARFTLAGLNDVVNESVHKLSSSPCARDEHLEPVLERINHT